MLVVHILLKGWSDVMGPSNVLLLMIVCTILMIIVNNELPSIDDVWVAILCLKYSFFSINT